MILRTSETIPYFGIVRCHLVHPMHNRLPGIAKSVMTIWKESGLLSNSNFENIQKRVDLVNLPASIGRIPGKVVSGYSDFTAEQWKMWTTVLSQYVTSDILPKEHFLPWCMFARACSVLCRPNIHISHLQQADDLLIRACTHFETLYGKERCTPNMHMHCDLRKSLLDVGIFIWSFSFVMVLWKECRKLGMHLKFNCFTKLQTYKIFFIWIPHQMHPVL